MQNLISSLAWAIPMMASVSVVAALAYTCFYFIELRLTPKGEGILGGFALLIWVLLSVGNPMFLLFSPLMAIGATFHRRSRPVSKDFLSAVAVMIFTNCLTWPVGIYLSFYWGMFFLTRPYANWVLFGSLLIYPNLIPVFFWAWRALRLRGGIDVSKDDLH